MDYINYQSYYMLLLYLKSEAHVQYSCKNDNLYQVIYTVAWYIVTLILFKKFRANFVNSILHGLLMNSNKMTRTHFPPKYTHKIYIQPHINIIGYTYLIIPFASTIPSCLQTTLAFSSSQSVSHILPIDHQHITQHDLL